MILRYATFIFSPKVYVKELKVLEMFTLGTRQAAFHLVPSFLSAVPFSAATPFLSMFKLVLRRPGSDQSWNVNEKI